MAVGKTELPTDEKPDILIVRMEAIRWDGGKPTLQRLKNWGAPVLDTSLDDSRVLHLEIEGKSEQAYLWDIVVRFDDGRFAIFSSLNPLSRYLGRPRA